MRSIDDDQTVPLPQTVVEPQPTPSCYTLEVEGWFSEDDIWCTDEDPNISTSTSID